ncbi:bacteriocin-type signal sequence-containing protein [Clostridium sp. DSM 8431]|nr:bacteriocin-type signal sequence-containing protein [Clostridium sp. DSM 8431]
MQNNLNFSVLNEQDLNSINGGGWKQAGAAFLEMVIIGAAPIIGTATGIGASVIGTPAIGIYAGIASGSGAVAAGSACLDYACK